MTEHVHDYRVDPFSMLASYPTQCRAVCISAGECDKKILYLPAHNYGFTGQETMDNLESWPKYDEAKTQLYARHPDVQNLMRWLTPNPNLPAPQKFVADRCQHLAKVLLIDLPDGPELTEGLRKLLEAKDCFVRASFGPEELR